MNRGTNDLLETAYRNLARETASMDWITAGLCVAAIILLQVFA